MANAAQARPTRRSIVLAAAAGLAGPGRAPALAAASPPSAVLRSIDPDDDDFEDLAPLARAIGGARVVQLGEPSHGAGAAFSAKARLVKFLHSQMGFDLLVWESGFYDVELTQAALQAGEDPVSAARRGIFGLWSNAAEVRPLFAYAAASRSSGRPLDMAGFDLQVTAAGSRERFASDLSAFAASPRDPELRAFVTEQAAAAAKARDRLFATRFGAAGDLDALSTAADALLKAIGEHGAAFETPTASLRSEFMAHAIENMRLDAIQRFESARSPNATVARENRRDERNFRNLRWLLERKHPRRKALIWAHNVHVMNAYYGPDFRQARARGRPGDMKPMGVFLRNWLGPDVYTVGLTTYEGVDGLATASATSPVAAAPAGSLEAKLHGLSQPYLFIDLRGAVRRDPAPLRGLTSARFPKYEASPAADLARAYDGLLYIDRMTPATALRA